MEEELLKEYVGTYLNPKYNGDWDVINSKFPELSGVDKQLLKEYVGTYLNPKYNSDWSVVNSKFPELFPAGQPTDEQSVAEQPKKKDSVSPFVDGGSELTRFDPTSGQVVQETPDFAQKQPEVKVPEQKLPARTEFQFQPGKPLPEQIQSAKPDQPEKKGGKSYLENIAINLGLGASYANEAVASIPESIINILAIPQNYIAEKTGLPIGVTAEGIKESWGITNPLLDYVKEDQKILSGEVSKFMADRYDDPSIVGNFEKGNYQEGFELLGSAITQSLPISVGLMIGGAYTAPSKLATVATLGFTEDQREELAAMDPTMSEAEKTLKAAGMAGMESVFSSIGTGTLGRVYKDIAKREGTDAAKNIFRDGLIIAYETALKKGGLPVAVAGNSLEEGAVRVSQNVISGRPIMDGVADAFITGGGSGVVFGAPISAVNAKRYIENKVTSYDTKTKVTEILKDKANNIGQVYNVPISSEISTTQLDIANLPNSRDLLVNDLKKSVSRGDIGIEGAKQSLFVFDKVQQVSNSVKDLNISNEEKARVATLLRQRDDLKTKIQNKDDVLVVQEKRQIEDINNQIQEILSAPKQEAASYKVDGNDVTVEAIDELIKTKSKDELLAMNIEINNDQTGVAERLQDVVKTKPKEDAIQEQAAGQVPVQPGTTVSQEVAQGEPQAEPEVFTQEGQAKEVTTKIPEARTTSEFADELSVKYGVDLELQENQTDKSISVPKIVVPKDQRNKGVGTKVMEDIVAYADKEGKRLILTPSTSFGGTSVKRLVDFYKSIGFVENKGKNKDFTIRDSMYRNPVAPTQEVDFTEEEVSELEKAISKNLPEYFQLATKKESPEKMAVLTDAATKLMDQVQPEIVKESEVVEQPSIDTIPITVTENVELANKVPKMSVNDLVGKKVNYVMADQLKVDDELMGGPFFPLMDDTFGKVAWASMDEDAAKNIIRGFIKGDYSVVYNMSPSAIDSNIATLNEFVKRLNSIPASDNIYPQISEYLKGRKFGKDTKAIQDLVDKSSNLESFIDGFKSLNVDQKQAIIKAVLPSKSVNATTKLGSTLQNNNITQESVREAISEQFARDLPMGAMTMVLEITDAEGNPIKSEADIDKAIMTRDQQVAEGIRPHKNYPVYIRGRAVAMLSDTVPVWNVSSRALDTMNKKAAGILQKKVPQPEGAVEGTQETRRFSAAEIRADEMYTLQRSATRAEEVLLPMNTQYQIFVEKLSKAIPSVEIVTSQVEFDNLMNDLNAKKLATKNQKIYGAVLNGKLYLNPGLENFNTPIHEFGHVWMNTVKELSPKIYNKGIDLIKNSEYVSQVEENPEYNRVTKKMKEDGMTDEQIRQYVLEEALATAIGDKGESFVNASQKRNFKNWLNELFQFIKKLTGISKLTPEQIQDLNLDEFLNSVVVDLLSEKPIFKNAEVKNLSNQLQLMARPDLNANDIVKIGLANGFSKGSIRELLKRRGFTQGAIDIALGKTTPTTKKAPSAQKIIGKPARKKVTVDEMAALKAQIKLEARAAREAKGNLNTKRNMIADAINKMATEGKITTKKAEAIVKRASRLNVDSEVSVNKFIDYVSKVFADAEYASKLSTGNALRNKIKSVSKNKDKSANLRDLGVKFSEIDPSMVEDIEQYNTIAKKIFESINGSTLKGGVKFADIVKVSDVSDYINDAIEKQNKEILNNKIAEMSELLGIEITEDEYFMLMESINNDEALPKKYKDGAIRKAINKAFDVYSAIINQMVDTGVDPITGEDISIDDSKKKVVRQFMDMDLNILSDKEALAAIDSLLNFIQNGSTAKMDAVYSRNLGEQKSIKLDKKNFKSSKIKKYFSESLGQFLVEQFTPLDIVMERMFKGVQKAGDFMFESGISALKKGKSLAQSLNNKIVDKYYNTFYKTKPNNQDFNTLFNTVERGMTAYMMRTKAGSESDINADFKRRKSLIKQSIDSLNKGNDKNKKLAEVYSEVYNKILDASNNYDDVVSNADAKNVDAVRFWQSEWANKYQALSDLSESIYNKTLGSDLNYTPDKVSSIGKDQKVDEDSDEINKSVMSFHSNNQTTYQRETGVLMKPTLDDKLPSESFIDLSFDSNNANSMYDALVDLNTANAVRQISGFFNSDSFKNIVPNIDDRKILKGRVNLFIRNIRNKNPYDNDEFAKAIRGLQNLAALGAGRALAGPTQALKQTTPVIANTIVNAGSIDLAAPFNEAKTNFINNSGYAIANRSAASINQIETLNKLSNKVSVSFPSKIADPLLQLNEVQLKLFLQKPDAYVARAAWMTYYEKSLKQQGIDTKSIDYATHELNDKAADYAQRQVDRQQNISDMDLAGKFVGSKNALAQFVNKTIMPFSSFRINQSARLGSDWAALTSKISTKEDKVIAARSLGGFFVELATFRAVSATISVVLASLAALISGKEDDEEDREKLFDTTIKGATTSSIIDIVSFLPYMDGIFQAGIAKSLDVAQDMLDVEDVDKFPFYDPREKSVLEGLGMLGIAGQRATELIELIDVAYTRDYKDDFGRTKYISEEDSNILKNFVLINILSSVGIASPEIKTMTRRTLANVKRRSTTNESGIKQERGSGSRSRGGGGRTKTINKSDLKKYFPDQYNELYGEGSATYEIEQEVKAFEKEQRELKKSIKDQVYGGKD